MNYINCPICGAFTIEEELVTCTSCGKQGCMDCIEVGCIDDNGVVGDVCNDCKILKNEENK